MWWTRPGVPRGARFTAFERGGREIDVLYQPRILELCRRRTPTDRRDPLKARLEPQAIEDRAEVVATQRDEADPWPCPEGRPVLGDAFVTGDQEHPHVGDVEEPCAEIEMAAPGHDDLGGMTSQAKGCPQRDQLRMPHGEERLPMNAAGSGKDGIGRDTRQAFVDQMLVRRASAERTGIGPARIAIPGLDEHE